MTVEGTSMSPALPLYLASALLLCADPMSFAAEEGPTLSQALEGEMMSVPYLEVVASSPVPAGIGVGSHYGWRTSTRTGRRTFHAGADFLAERGTPVYAVRGGVVETVAVETRRTRRFAGYGNAIVVRHEDTGEWSFYAHLDGVAVEEGDVVVPGQPLGLVGSTTNGRFPGMVPHLHFEVREATADGESPFPGPYRRYNLDPEEWLADLGVRYHHDEEAEDCVMHGEGEAPAPVLVVRAAEPTLVADNHFGHAAF